MRRNRILQKKWSNISHKRNDWLINQFSTGISLPKIYTKTIANKTLLLVSTNNSDKTVDVKLVLLLILEFELLITDVLPW